MQLDKVSHAVQRYHTGIRRIDVKLSTRGTGETNRGKSLPNPQSATAQTPQHGSSPHQLTWCSYGDQ